jgi:hypothetical protein
MMGLFDDIYGTPEAAPAPAAKPKQKPYVPLQQVMPNAPQAASQAATIQPSNAQLPELVPSQPPAGLTPKARNEFIANEANRIAAEKIKRSTENKKPLTETQSNATAFGMRMLESNQILNALEDKGVTDTGIFRSAVSGTVGLTPFIGKELEEKTSEAMNVLPGFLGGPSAEQQQVDQARRNFVTANLRKESGAAISPAEFATEEKKYFPQVGDAPPVIKQKRDARELAIRAMNIQSGNNIPNINSSNNDPLGLRKK